MRNVRCSWRGERKREIFSVHKKDLTKWVNEKEEEEDDDGYEQAARIKTSERRRAVKPVDECAHCT